MNQKTAIGLLEKCFRKQECPVTPEGIIEYLVAYDGLTMKDQQVGKIRDYVKRYILSKMTHRIAGGVIYPTSVTGNYNSTECPNN